METPEIVRQLKSIPRLALLDDAALADLATVVGEEWYEAGHAICTQGERGDRLYAIALGQVVVKSVEGGREITVTQLLEGDIFGERALVEDLPRTATIVAETRVRLLSLHRADYQQLLLKHPNLKRILVGPEVIPLLSQLPLFSRLSRAELASLAEHVGVVFYPPGREVVKQGDMGTTMYVVLKGGLVAYQLDPRGRNRPVKALEEGDAFGETSLLVGEPRDATVMTKTYTELCYIHKASFEKFLADNPGVRSKLRARREVERKRKAKTFAGQKPGEAVEIMDSKHWVAFVGALGLPALGLTLTGTILLVLDVLWFASVREALGLSWLLTVLSVICFLSAVVVFGWYWVDWRNDYHIVTNQRVIHIENVLWRATSREEIPIQKVQNIHVEQDLWGEVLGYGRVTVTTAGKAINLEYVHDPEEFQYAIFEQMGRAQYRAVLAERTELRQAIRRAMGLNVLEEQAKGQPPPAQPKREKWFALFTRNRLVGRLRKMMTESGLAIFVRRPHLPHTEIRQEDQVIWRKHWGVLIKVTYRPLLLFVVLLVFFLISLAARLGWFNVLDLLPSTFDVALLALGLSLLPAWAWLAWEVEDWRNDLYIVTDTHIIDIERTPLLLKESKRQARLDDIQNTQAATKGFWAGLFKLGDVTIETAGEGVFTFKQVRNPTKVQEEIDKRRNARRDRLRQEQVNQQRADIAKWFSVYHEVASEEQRRSRRQFEEGPPSTWAEESEEQAGE